MHAHFRTAVLTLNLVSATASADSRHPPRAIASSRLCSFISTLLKAVRSCTSLRHTSLHDVMHAEIAPFLHRSSTRCVTAPFRRSSPTTLTQPSKLREALWFAHLAKALALFLAARRFSTVLTCQVDSPRAKQRSAIRSMKLSKSVERMLWMRSLRCS